MHYLSIFFEKFNKLYVNLTNYAPPFFFFLDFGVGNFLFPLGYDLGLRAEFGSGGGGRTPASQMAITPPPAGGAGAKAPGR